MGTLRANVGIVEVEDRLLGATGEGCLDLGVALEATVAGEVIVRQGSPHANTRGQR